ncbi:MAG: PEP-CTERM sorting domain-containing protein [Verrucomicrobiales bacterium]|nr:PEP-CTERM sorting domain-containing protein [Verrucomicrobiales bacterium]
MNTWTTAARDELERYFARLGPWLKATGADPAEVIEDLREHLRRELENEQLKAVTEADVRRVLGKIGAPEPELPSEPPQEAGAPSGSTRKEPLPPRPGYSLFLFGVALPLVTLILELTTGMCAAVFFDPLPTLGHVLLVALVPLANWLAWESLRKGRGNRVLWLAWLNALAVGVAAFYSVLYLPLMVPGLFAMIVYGWGLLPWSPMISLVAGLLLRRHLRRLAGTSGVPRLPAGWKGLLAAWGVILVLGLPDWATRVGLDLAASPEPATRQRGLGVLRSVGSEEAMLRACYGRTRNAANMDLVGLVLTGGRDVPPQTARRIYYRVKGRPFNGVPPPRVRTARGAFAELEDWTWDVDQAGEAVGGRIKGLHLRSSRLDAVADASAAWSYTEWILEFENTGSRQREARAQVLLPPGGVVSRLTLWVNGEEREAAFAGRSHTRQAYENIVRQRQDPVLVSTAGPDRVLVQCFPVPPNGGLMKIRIGITAPLLLPDAEAGLYLWPRFVERNFSIPENLHHTAWLEANNARAVTCEALRAETVKEGVQAARGELSDADLDPARSRVRLERSGGPLAFWTRDPRTLGDDIVEQGLLWTNRPPASRVVFAVDASVGMSDELPAVAEAIRNLPADIGADVILAGDEPVRLGVAEREGAPLSHEELARRVERARCLGGQDNLPALVRAWDLASESPGGVVVWIHAPQPAELSPADALRQRYDRRPGGPRIDAIQTRPGPNELLEALDGLAGVQSIPRLSALRDDLGSLLGRLTQGVRFIEFARRRRSGEGLRLEEAGRTGNHIARLWAKDEIDRLREKRETGAAIRLAGEFQLVTPVSGAVVLESQAQFEAAGLTPVDPQTVPAIPEPGTRALLVLGVAVLFLRRHR